LNQQQYEFVIDRLGVPMEFTQAKTGTKIPIPKAGIATPKADSDIVNSYGAGSKVVTLKASSVSGITPEKFDSVVINGVETLVFDHVLPVHEPASGKVIGHRCIVRGK
jgi:hypothetical protein